ncbi:peptide chain release factor N(5)-glutamine methyltransferase [Carboxylicivirga sp. M1479]|uniref:peptide chain release factor N(5)-glutamine methyltransferase n=1 Tax=Carboxylicivirga sp. M1479 TaxID=2594476 RepID=UPI00117807D6|nr:peptide chain release factor N(5)-glutamine methyltransferase [Carboxylicivirga sp. M1479]TRX72143.1 peptide chain release factor N(5)-glutamine methyltransferase [Carboxylicivirga sp. M1479]
MSGTTIHQFTSKLLTELSDYYPEYEIRQMAKLLLQEVLKVSNTELLMMNREQLDEKQLQILDGYKEQLKQHIPLQYIIGHTEFYNLQFSVSPAVLIPRPETEELVNWILTDQLPINSLLDIGTGSGCIATALKANMPNTQVTAWDISEEALAVAKQNAKHLKQEVQFELIDVLNHQPNAEKFDCIVSNPPYVRELEKSMMEANVLENEPHTALFVKDTDPLLFYRSIALLAKQILNPQGYLYFEINEYLAKDMEAMLSTAGFNNIEYRKDINGKDRMMKARLKS